MSDGYVITSIDPSTNAVYATLTIGGSKYNHTVFVNDVNNAKDIERTVEDGFNKVKAEIAKNAPASSFPEAVSDLIGKTKEAK